MFRRSPLDVAYLFIFLISLFFFFAKCINRIKSLSSEVILSVPASAVLSRFSIVRLFATLRTVARQAPLSMRFSRQEYWSGLPCPSPGDLPDPGIEPASLMSPALAAGSLPLAPPGKQVQPGLKVCLVVSWMQQL